jgi:hypothetical protein
MSWFRNTRRHYFGTCQYDSHQWFAPHPQMVMTGHGCERNVAGVQFCSGGDQHFTGGSFFAGRTDMAAKARLTMLCSVI